MREQGSSFLNRLRFHVAASRIHKWLALVIGAQLLIWFASGTIMSVLPIGNVRGEHLIDRDRAVSLPADLDLSGLNAAIGSASSATIRMVDGRAVAQIERAEGGSILVDVRTGQPLPPFGAAAAERIVRSAWRGAPSVTATTRRVDQQSTEYRGRLPAWQVTLSDAESTRVYVEAASGQIAAVRNGTWRLYDFFWGLHIMDWKNHQDFNSWWLLSFAVGGLVMGLAGTVLLFMRWPIRRRRKRPAQ
ncbi:MAG: PepSY domain-containing protein [Novosphingobium sp.]|nr:PepSY domain-containing protein [Novosphingobium sp.]